MTDKTKKSYRLNSDIPPWGIEMHKAIDEIVENYHLDSKNLITFLTATLVQELIKLESSEEDVIELLDGIFQTYLKVKQILEKKGFKK